MKDQFEVISGDDKIICRGRRNPQTSKTTNQPVRQKTPETKTLILDEAPLITAVANLNVVGAVGVYALLFESAYRDKRYDSNLSLPWSLRRDSGATTDWSVKGIANELHLGQAKVRQAIDTLLDNGFIRVLGYVPTGKGSKKRLFQVIKHNQLEAVRHSISVIGTAYGKTSTSTPTQIDVEPNDAYCDEATEFLVSDYDPNFCGLWNGDFTANVKDRLATYSSEHL